MSAKFPSYLFQSGWVLELICSQHCQVERFSLHDPYPKIKTFPTPPEAHKAIRFQNLNSSLRRLSFVPHLCPCAPIHGDNRVNTKSNNSKIARMCFCVQASTGSKKGKSGKDSKKQDAAIKAAADEELSAQIQLNGGVPKPHWKDVLVVQLVFIPWCADSMFLVLVVQARMGFLCPCPQKGHVRIQQYLFQQLRSPFSGSCAVG